MFGLLFYENINAPLFCPKQVAQYVIQTNCHISIA